MSDGKGIAVSQSLLSKFRFCRRLPSVLRTQHAFGPAGVFKPGFNATLGQSTETHPKDWTSNKPSSATQPPKHRHKMKVFVTLALLALLLTMVMGSPFPKRKSDEENMDIYRKCRGKFGTSPKVECR